MPQEEVFLERRIGDRRIMILKTYDQSYAREAFGNMGEDAQAHLWKSLPIEESYEAADVPALHSQGGEDFLWDELLEASREDGNILSFFVVTETRGTVSKGLYIAPDWPSAEKYAQTIIAGA
jgi:hypothetical protein